MLLDVDQFEGIDDTLSHASGDRVLLPLTCAIAPLLLQDALAPGG